MGSRVTESDREYFRRLGRASRALERTEGPAGTLKEALRRMGEIERTQGIDMLSPEMLESWPDRESHFAYLKAVKRMAAKERKRKER